MNKKTKEKQENTSKKDFHKQWNKDNYPYQIINVEKGKIKLVIVRGLAVLGAFLLVMAFISIVSNSQVRFIQNFRENVMPRLVVEHQVEGETLDAINNLRCNDG